MRTELLLGLGCTTTATSCCPVNRHGGVATMLPIGLGHLGGRSRREGQRVDVVDQGGSGLGQPRVLPAAQANRDQRRVSRATVDLSGQQTVL